MDEPPRNALPDSEYVPTPADLCATLDRLNEELAGAEIGEEAQLHALIAVETMDAWGIVAGLRGAEFNAVSESLQRLQETTDGQLWASQILTSAVTIARTPRGAKGAVPQFNEARDQISKLITETGVGDATMGLAFVLAADLRLRKVGPRQQILLPDDPDAGVDIALWSRAMSRYIQNVNMLGADRAKTLYRECGIVNFDRYDYSQLERMSLFLEGDEETLERLRNSDVTAAISTVFDDNGAFGEQIQAYDDPETSDGNKLFFEAAHPAAIYRMMIRLKKAGILPSNLVLMSHSVSDRLGFGSGNVEHDVVLAQIIDTEDLDEEEVEAIGSAQFFDLELVQVARLAHEFMRTGSQGERNIVLSGCYQAAVHKDLQRSVAEAIAILTDPEDSVAVCAADAALSVRRVQDAGENDPKVRFWSDEADLPTHVYRHMRDGSIHHEVMMGIPGTE